jgi:hypothetical protein
MASFDRFDIVEAHAVLEWDYNVGGWLRERPSNLRRMEATACQLHRMKFRPSINLGLNTLSDNGKEIYFANVLKWNLPLSEEMRVEICEFFGRDWMDENYPRALDAGNYH